MIKKRYPRPTITYRHSTAREIKDDSRSANDEASQTELTLVILGTPRGGTTSIAGLAQRCGIDIGSDLPVNLEDPAFTINEPKKIIATISQRNKMKKVWGWKFPRAAVYLEQVQPYLINPHYIMVWRDIYSTSFRRVTRGGDQIEALLWAQSVQQQNLDILKRLNGPTLMVSYADAISEPAAVANDICDFVGVQPDYEIQELYEFAVPGFYKSKS